MLANSRYLLINELSQITPPLVATSLVYITATGSLINYAPKMK